jgi:hypothetical protein
VNDRAVAGFPWRVAVAIVHTDPPEVLLASNADVLSRLVALKVVAQTDPRDLDQGSLLPIREALLEGRWADAVFEWIEAGNQPVDAYPDEDVWTEARLDEESASLEIRLQRIFDDVD